MVSRDIVLTGDLKSSRKLKDRAKVQESLKNSLNEINATFKKGIVAKFRIVQGDSFQGMISSPDHLFDIYYILFGNITHKFYLGIGIGEIYTDLSGNVEEIDGEVFHKAICALEKAKRHNYWIVFEAGWKIDGILTYLLNFMADIMWNWTDRQREIVIHYRKMKNQKNEYTLRDLAEEIGVRKQTISKILKRSRYKILEDAEKSFKDYVSQKWLTEECKPEMADDR